MQPRQRNERPCAESAEETLALRRKKVKPLPASGHHVNGAGDRPPLIITGGGDDRMYLRNE